MLAAGRAVFHEAEATAETMTDDAHTLGAHREVMSHLRGAQRCVVTPLRRRTQADAWQIVVEKLTKNVHENHLREIFGAYGNIQELDLPMNRQCPSPAPLKTLI